MDTPLPDPFEELYRQLLKQPFSVSSEDPSALSECVRAVKSYVDIEKCLAVLSDLKANKSYIFPGAAGQLFNLGTDPFEIDSAFEDDIFGQINKEDLARRHILELEYIKLQKSIPFTDRLKYTTSCKLRVEKGTTQSIVAHRTIYIKSLADGSVWLSLCLYTLVKKGSFIKDIDGRIVNNETGEEIRVPANNESNKSKLTKREIELLSLASQGITSKEIATQMQISQNTVHRHRQNLIAKMKVNNLTEAVKSAIVSGII